MHKVLPLLASLSIGTAASAQFNVFSTTLTGHQEVPSVATPAEGGATVTTNRDGFIIAFSSVDTLALTAPIDEEIGAHIHLGYTGENGPITVGLPYENIFDDENNFTGARLRDTTLSGVSEGRFDSLITAMSEGRAYVNVHTLNYPGGEVRGQLINRAGLTGFYDAMAYGEQQNPARLTEGMGGIFVEVRADSMFVTGAFSLESPARDVMGTPAHLHTGYFGQNGPIALGLNPTLEADRLSGVFERSENAFPVPEGLPDAMFAGRVYLNVHSEAFPAGEIRGQVVRAHSNVYFSHVSDIDPVPNPNASAYMRLMAEKPVGQDVIAFSGSYTGYGNSLPNLGLAPFARISNPLQDGDPLAVSPLLGEYDADSDVGVILSTARDADDDQLQALYLRLGTSAGIATPEGAVVRDQGFYHECKRAFYSGFTAAQSVSSTASQASGEIITEYYGSRVEVNGLIRNLSSAIRTDIQGGFHIHNGLAGSTGPIVAPVGFVSAGAGTAAFLPDRAIINLTPEQATAMKERRYYYNIHTENYPMGEVRAQILPRANAVLHAAVGPTQAFPAAVNTEARGGLLVELDGQTAVASGSFNGLRGFNPNVAGGAHLHEGMPGVAGGIVYPLVTDAALGAREGAFLPAANTIAIERDGQLDSMLNRELYVNIHSEAAPSGEIRGQLAPYANSVTVAAVSSAFTKPFTGMATGNRGTGRLVGEVYDTTVVAYGRVSDLSSDIDTDVAGGGHLHRGTVGETGGIAFGFDFEDTPDTTGVIAADDNVFTFTSEQVDTLLTGGYYANFHTDNAPSGAVRGQMLRGTNVYPDSVLAFEFPEDEATVLLNDGDLDTEAVIDWMSVDDPDGNLVAYYWTLFTDTTAAPIVRTEIDTASQVVFTFGALDTLLAGLGVDSGAVATVFHKAWSTDGSLLTDGAFSTVSLTRRGMLVGVDELPAGAARLVNTAGARELYLDIDALPDGDYRYDIASASGQVVASRQFGHGGGAQRYVVDASDLSAGIYFLRLSDAAGAAQTWGFVVR